MTALGQVLIVISVLAGGIICGTDVFSAIVLRPALALVDEQTLVSAMGRVHGFADRRLRVPGVACTGTAIAGTALAAWAVHLGAAIAGTIAVAALASWLIIYARISAPSTPGLSPFPSEENFRLMPGCSAEIPAPFAGSLARRMTTPPLPGLYVAGRHVRASAPAWLAASCDCRCRQQQLGCVGCALLP